MLSLRRPPANGSRRYHRNRSTLVACSSAPFLPLRPCKPVASRMADSQHITWLLEGVDSWNKRREEQEFTPDLSGTNIYEEFRRAGRLDSDGHIPLARMNLNRANLRDSCQSKSLHGADLTCANLFGAQFQDARLPNSRLNGANIVGARFDSANLNQSKLCNVKAGSTSFRGTHLFGADLTGAQMNIAFFGSATLSKLTSRERISRGRGPWEARLFQDRHLTTKPNAQAGHSKRITCVADLIRECTELEAFHADNVIYLRGERTNTWNLRPSVMRRAQDAKFSLRDKGKRYAPRSYVTTTRGLQ